MHSLSLILLETEPPLFILFFVLMMSWACFNIGLKIENRLDCATADFFMKQCRDPDKNEAFYANRPFPRPIWWRSIILWSFPNWGLWLLRKKGAARY